MKPYYSEEDLKLLTVFYSNVYPAIMTEKKKQGNWTSEYIGNEAFSWAEYMLQTFKDKIK